MLLILTGMILTTQNTLAETKYLDFDSAFKINVTQNPHNINIQIMTAPKHYLYKRQTFITINGEEIKNDSWTSLQFKDDPHYGYTPIIIDHGRISIVPKTKGLQKIEILTQGCSELGLCYIPQTKSFLIENYDGETNEHSSISILASILISLAGLAIVLLARSPAINRNTTKRPWIKKNIRIIGYVLLLLGATLMPIYDINELLVYALATIVSIKLIESKKSHYIFVILLSAILIHSLNTAHTITEIKPTNQAQKGL